MILTPEKGYGARLRLILASIPGGAILLGSSPSLIIFLLFCTFLPDYLLTPLFAGFFILILVYIL
jgi:hypothetical protein